MSTFVSVLLVVGAMAAAYNLGYRDGKLTALSDELSRILDAQIAELTRLVK